MSSVDHLETLIGVVATLLTSLTGFILALRRIERVHGLVNSQLANVLRRVDQLTEALHAGGVDVPTADATGHPTDPSGARISPEPPAVSQDA